MIKKIFTFGSLYVSEGIESAISTVVLPIYLARMGYNAAVVGIILSITSLPWVLKFLWGLLTDKYANKGRRVFILTGGLIGFIMNLLIFVMTPNIASLLISLIFIARCGIATLDVSTDALAISISKKNERGMINGAEFTGQVIGFSIGSIYFTRLMSINPSIPFFAAAMIIVAMVSTVFLIKDVKMKPSLRKLKHLITKDTLKFITEIILINLPFGMLGIAAFFMKVYLHFTDASVGLIMMYSGILSATGTLLGGYLSDKIGRKKVVIISIVGFGLAILPAITHFVPFYLAASLFSGAVVSSLCAWCMDKTKKEVAATEFSIFTSTANLGSVIGTSIGGVLLHLMSFEFFAVVAVSVIIPIVGIHFFSKTS